MVGILILFKGYLAKFLVKYYFALLVLISAALNIRLWTKTVPINYPENGGYFSWPLIWILEKGLKNDT